MFNQIWALPSFWLASKDWRGHHVVSVELNPNGPNFDLCYKKKKKID